ncbi:uncharacterized protein LOC131556005 isoform X1 [Ammospiza caudacuta]|uniref:uncharacterized protein LOC131556005 isoform X1 n=1 Tax=Ammospiza caudacuta TaxID=2857398 RepID=UPI002738E6BC|nr:uncharacterized protein LOC131556005 isoform X1 [Ammospiza caudacuta]
MKPLPSLFILALLLMPWVLGPAPGQGPGVMLGPCCDAAAAAGARGSSQEHWEAKPELASPWLLAYVPIRSCHRVLKDKYGAFSPPAFHADFPVSFWCNWTIWAGSRKHIIIYIQGFITKDACNKNEDKILFEGVSSLVENSVVYACWKKEMHVFATFAQAVHVVLLKRYLPNQRDGGFKGKYYIFQDQQGASSSKDGAISGTSAPKLQKKGGGFQSGWVGNLRGALGFAATRGSSTVLSSEQMQGRGITVDTMAVGRPTELLPRERARTQALETTAPSELGSQLLEAPGIGTPEGIIPTAAQDTWGQNPSVSEGSAVSSAPVHSVPLETPVLGAFQGAEPFWQPAGVSLESSQPVLRPKGLGHLQLTIRPTGLALAAHSEPLSPGTGQSQQGTDPSRDSQLSRASLEKEGSNALLSVPADGLTKGLVPSLRSPSDVVTRDHLQSLPDRSQSSLGRLSVPKPELGTTGLQHTKLMDIFPLGSFGGAVRRRTALHPTAPGLAAPALATGLEHPLTPVPALGTEAIPVPVISSTVPVPAGFGSLDLVPEAPLPPQVESLPMVPSPPAALDWDTITLRQRNISPASPGGQEMVSPRPPCHASAASELGTDESSRCLGPGKQKQKLVLGQGGEITSSVGLMARSPSPVFVTVPGPAVRLAQPEGHVSRGSGVTPASLSDTREVPKVPVQHQDSAASDKPASVSISRGSEMQGVTETVQVGAGQRTAASFSTTPAHPDLPAAPWGEALPRDQKPWEPSGVARNTQMAGGQQGKHADVSELGPPWVTEFFPIRSCHRVLRDGSGLFHLPLHVDIKANIWCNWTIWAGPQKHIVIYVQGFQGSDGCGNNQDRIIFQGVSSSLETKVVFACHNRGTLVFAAQATEVQVLLLSGSGSRSHEYRYFRGQYYVFRDSEAVDSSNDTIAAPQEPVQETSKNESWRTVETKGLLSMLTAPPGPPTAPAGGRIQPGVVSPEEMGQHSPDLMEDDQSGANQSERGQDETRLEKNLKDRGSKGREAEGDMLMEPAPAGQDTGGKAEPPALELSPGTALVTVVPCHLAGSPCSEMPSSSVGVSASGSPSEVAAAAHHTQTPELAEPPLSTSTKPPLYPSPGVTAADVVPLGGRTEEILDLISSVGNDTGLQSQHHPGDVLFEVTAEIKPKDWIPHGVSEVQKGLLESLKDHIQKNLKLSANRVSEIKLKDVKRTSDANLLLTFWLHLEPEDRNVSLLLRSHLEELLGTSVGVEKLQLVSLFVEDVNECQAGLGLCGEEAECFNGVGTYLCRCKQGYEDHSPTKSGTLCIRAPRAGISTFLRHADMLVGAALVAGLVLLVAFGGLCVTALCGQAPRRSPRPEEPAVRAVEEPAMELHSLGQCLQLDPLQLKLRARAPEWLWNVRVPPGQAGQGQQFPEQPPPL